ncbi:TlpA family protein disulfide reductase [Faecalibacter macacae]|uniref:TlpA family protein disulfide reductase n=1 Tax=Faecalibacter macacae TaxID=1859289 RepID=A0A3L9M2N4_9FLAO|nr:TlpA disulfide reductase family protein [Faecalibacter macacae]RLZ07168.1 TlpA family protein disulfide reductase [Faecalibacter macacae]
MNKLIDFLKKNRSNIFVLAIGITLLISTEAKAFLQQGLMKVGLFQPKIEKEIVIKDNSNNLNFEMRDLNGNVVSLSDLKGKVVFLNFWATWCPPCIAEMPSIQQLHDKFKNDDEVLILTLEVDGKQEKIQKFINRKKLTVPVYIPNSSIPTELFEGTLPTTIIFDKQGNIAHTTLGMADYSGQDIVDFLNEVKALH